MVKADAEDNGEALVAHGSEQPSRHPKAISCEVACKLVVSIGTVTAISRGYNLARSTYRNAVQTATWVWLEHTDPVLEMILEHFEKPGGLELFGDATTSDETKQRLTLDTHRYLDPAQ